MTVMFSELPGTGLIAVRGADAAAFLQAQLTSDISRIGTAGTQYSGYCSPKGRLLATFLVWRCEDEFLLQLPESLRETVEARLTKYVLRAQVKLAKAQRQIFGLWGPDAAAVLEPLAGAASDHDHDVWSSQSLCLTRLPGARYLVTVSIDGADSLHAALSSAARKQAESAWSALDIAAGVPVITAETQEEYVPQMVNLDLLGGVSYTKGCYPGQEIVARTHYLGRLKQRMYRVRVPAEGARPGDRLYSEAFGAEQSSGALLNVAPFADGGHDALAVIQTSGVGQVHWKSAGGPAVELKALPYALTEPA